MAVEPQSRATRIAEIRQQIAALQQELERLEREETEGPYPEYVARVRAIGRAPIAEAQFERYNKAHEQLEREWVRRNRPTSDWQHLAVFAQLRNLLALSPIEGAEQPGSAPPSQAPVPAARQAAAADQSGSNGAEGEGSPAPAAPKRPTVPIEQLIEMHNPILNECVELTKRAGDEFKRALIFDGLISVERAMYLLERVVYAPPAMPGRVAQVANEALKGTITQESDRLRLTAVRDRAVKLATETPAR